jgi:hypothetical protein
MYRREFLLASGGAMMAAAAPAPSAATVLYGDRSVALDHAKIDGNELWVRPKDLPRINEFELKPQGACRADICIPVPKTLTKNGWFDLTGFARRTGEAFVADSAVWSLGEIPVLRGAYLNSRIAPEFSVPDRRGRAVRLSEFRGKKVFVLTWASW